MPLHLSSLLQSPSVHHTLLHHTFILQPFIHLSSLTFLHPLPTTPSSSLPLAPPCCVNLVLFPLSLHQPHLLPRFWVVCPIRLGLRPKNERDCQLD